MASTPGGASRTRSTKRRNHPTFLRSSSAFLARPPSTALGIPTATRAVVALGDSGGETTGIVVALTASKLVGASAGDCEAWVIHSKDVANLTVEAEHPSTARKRSSGAHYFRACGPRGRPPRRERWSIFKYASMQVIARLVRASPISVAAEQLIELVRLPSGKFHDDMAAILVARKPAPLLS
jgi:hypothetical protein